MGGPDLQTPRRWTRTYSAIAVLVAVAAGVVAVVLLTRGPDAADGGATGGRAQTGLAQELRQRLGADSCSEAGLALENQANGSREIVFDCAFPSRRRCITVANGIARDATADVRRLFASMPGRARPDCASS